MKIVGLSFIMNVVKLHHSVLVLFIIITSCKTDDASLCALSKVNDKCRCEYKTCEITHFPELYADCQWIELTEFPRNSQFPEDLKHLDLSHNGLVSLKNDFRSEILVELNLAYNSLDYVEFGFFENFPNLRILDLSHNGFKKLNPLFGLTQLSYLDLSFNQLETLVEDLFTPTKNLRNLNLGYNNLGKFLEKIPNLFAADFNLNSNITDLNLSKLNLSKISSTFFDDAALTRLNLADNFFDDIPPIPTSVTNLDFSGNNVTILSVRHLRYRELKILRLNRMKDLQTIADYAFYNMENLEELYLENCPKLKRLNDLAFGVIRPNPDDLKLKKISFAGSGLQRLNATYLHLFNNLDYINLQSNPWICDCGIKWMQTFKDSFYQSDNVRCAFPSNIRDKKIMELTPNELPDCSVNSQSFQFRKVLIPILAAIVMILMIVVVCQIYLGPYLHSKYRNMKTEPSYRPESPDRRDETYVY